MAPLPCPDLHLLNLPVPWSHPLPPPPGKVDGDPVPVPHFGAALTEGDFHALAERLRGRGVCFEMEPHLR